MMGHLRLNYRLRQQDIYPAVVMTNIPSQLVHLRQTWQIDSLTGDVLTFSLSGFGHPDWVFLLQVSNHETHFRYRLSWENGVSLIYVSLFYTGSFGSLAATVSYAFYITALIASR